MAWNSLPEPPKRTVAVRKTDPELRILNQRSGYLNRAAQALLFGTEPGGRIDFQRDESGRFSIVSGPDLPYVVRRGRVTVTRLTSAVEGSIPITLLLNLGDEPRRLLITGARP